MVLSRRTRSLATARRWLAGGTGGLDGVIAKRLDLAYRDFRHASKGGGVRSLVPDEPIAVTGLTRRAAPSRYPVARAVMEAARWNHGGSIMSNMRTWDQEDLWWHDNFSSRPYATGRTYEEFRPAYRYGFESGSHNMGRSWNDVENDLRTGWEKYEGKGSTQSTWENIKDAVRDAWHRVTGQKDLEAERMSERNVSNVSRGNTL